jgi:uncharacterized membrane protein
VEEVPETEPSTSSSCAFSPSPHAGSSARANNQTDCDVIARDENRLFVSMSSSAQRLLGPICHAKRARRQLITLRAPMFGPRARSSACARFEPDVRCRTRLRRALVRFACALDAAGARLAPNSTITRRGVVALDANNSVCYMVSDFGDVPSGRGIYYGGSSYNPNCP